MDLAADPGGGYRPEGTSADRWISGLIVFSCLIFILVLGLSAIFDPSIRWLHLFQALIYVAVIVLTRDHSPLGYGAGCVIAAFWNWTNLVHTRFIETGWHELADTLRTGQLNRPDLIVGVFAAFAHFLLIAACVAGFFCLTRRSASDVMRFAAGGAIAVASFVVMIVLFGPQYMPLLEQVFGLP